MFIKNLKFLIPAIPRNTLQLYYSNGKTKITCSTKREDPTLYDLCAKLDPCRPAVRKLRPHQKRAVEANRKECCTQYREKIPRHFSAGGQGPCPKPPTICPKPKICVVECIEPKPKCKPNPRDFWTGRPFTEKQKLTLFGKEFLEKEAIKRRMKRLGK